MKETNKLIAQFMGWNIQNLTTIPTNLHLSNLELDNREVMELKFHTSWDWLMPVIQKCLIGQTEVSRGLTNTNVSRILDGLCYQDMSRTYNAVVEFIKDQNNIKNN